MADVIAFDGIQSGEIRLEILKAAHLVSKGAHIIDDELGECGWDGVSGV
jgi:hypothetical protein